MARSKWRTRSPWVWMGCCTASTRAAIWCAWSDLARPDDVCVDDAGNVFVAELGERAALFPFMPSPWGQNRPARISVLDLDGKVQMRWGEDPAGGIQFVAPHGIAVDSSGNV